VYGPGEILGAGQWRGTPHTVWRNVTPTFIWKALNREALPVENGGIATRDFIFVEDIARANLLAMKSEVSDEVFNVASGVETSLSGLAEALLHVMGSDLKPEFGPARKVNPVPRRLADTAKAARLLGFCSQISLEEGLRRLVDWWCAERQHAGVVGNGRTLRLNSLVPGKAVA
jgi:nucleoside-diphosphate-sugar epimerase